MLKKSQKHIQNIGITINVNLQRISEEVSQLPQCAEYNSSDTLTHLLHSYWNMRGSDMLDTSIPFGWD